MPLPIAVLTPNEIEACHHCPTVPKANFPAAIWKLIRTLQQICVSSAV